MKREYDIPVPRGVPKDWEANSIVPESAGEALRRYYVPEGWGVPTKAVGWFDRFGRQRCLVGHYLNGRSALVRIDANGNWKTSFGDVE